MLTKHRVMKELGHGTPGGVMGHAGVSAPGSARPPPRSVLWTPQPAWPRRVGRRGVCAVRLSGRSCADALAAWVAVLVSSPGPWAHTRATASPGAACPPRPSATPWSLLDAVLWALTLDGQVPATPLLGVTDGAATEKPPRA